MTKTHHYRKYFTPAERRGVAFVPLLFLRDNSSPPAAQIHPQPISIHYLPFTVFVPQK